MDDLVKQNISLVCSILNDNNVMYLVIGGTAVGFYGFYRLSRDESGKPVEKHDLDLWYNPTYENYFKLLKALRTLGQDVSEFEDEIAPNPKKSVFKIELRELTVDFLPEIKGIPRFYKCYSEKQDIMFNEIAIPLISLEHLILAKETIGRQKDLDDIKQLKSRPDKN